MRYEIPWNLSSKGKEKLLNIYGNAAVAWVHAVMRSAFTFTGLASLVWTPSTFTLLNGFPCVAENK